MKELFASIFEFFGFPIYDAFTLGDWLRGWDPISQSYSGTDYYSIFGIVIILICSVFYALQYHIIDSSTFNKAKHLWLMVLSVCVINFLIAFGIPYNELIAGNIDDSILFTTSDCIAFGISVAIWSLIIMALLTSFPYPRMWGDNCRFTTLWNPF
mgnify:FL=1